MTFSPDGRFLASACCRQDRADLGHPRSESGGPCAPRARLPRASRGLPPRRPATRHRRGHAVCRRPLLVRRRGEALGSRDGARCSMSSAATHVRVRGLASSPDGRRLATASDDRTIKLWDTSTGQEVFTLRGHRLRRDQRRLQPRRPADRLGRRRRYCQSLGDERPVDSHVVPAGGGVPCQGRGTPVRPVRPVRPTGVILRPQGTDSG